MIHNYFANGFFIPFRFRTNVQIFAIGCVGYLQHLVVDFAYSAFNNKINYIDP